MSRCGYLAEYGLSLYRQLHEVLTVYTGVLALEWAQVLAALVQVTAAVWALLLAAAGSAVGSAAASSPRVWGMASVVGLAQLSANSSRSGRIR